MVVRGGLSESRFIAYYEAEDTVVIVIRVVIIVVFIFEVLSDDLENVISRISVYQHPQEHELC